MTKLTGLNQKWVRLLSLLMAIALSSLILVFPQALTNEQGHADHGRLMLLLTGICIGFIHGIGFAPRSIPWRQLLSPITSWPIMLYGLFIML